MIRYSSDSVVIRDPEDADTVGLAVGLHAGYGSAQRMYVKRGHLPDEAAYGTQTAPVNPIGNIPTTTV